MERIVFGMGCFWGAERRLAAQPGVIGTEVGYMGGRTEDPDYRQVCSGATGHAEVVAVTYDPARTTPQALLAAFWESHDPTQGMRQGNDRGTQYRSAVYVGGEAQREAAERTRDAYQAALDAAGKGRITTEIAPQGRFWTAEAYHQKYLEKNPNGYCGLGGTGVAYPR